MGWLTDLYEEAKDVAPIVSPMGSLISDDSIIDNSLVGAVADKSVQQVENQLLSDSYDPLRLLYDPTGGFSTWAKIVDQAKAAARATEKSRDVVEFSREFN